MQKNVEYIVLEKINRCADCGRRLIGKTGEKPARSRHCNDAAAFKSDACLCVEAVSTSDGDSKLA